MCDRARAAALPRGQVSLAANLFPPNVPRVQCSACRKGAALPPPEVRAAITAYVKARGLTAADRKGAVALDAALAAALGRQEQVRPALGS